MADFYIGQGDTASPLTDTLKDADGVAVDLQGADIAITAIPVEGGTKLLNAAAATNAQVGDGSDGSKGKVSYTWTAGQTNTAGLFFAAWTVTFNDGSIQTFPNGGYLLLEVLADAPTPAATRFASSADLASRLGLDFTADEHVRANDLLARASALIQDATATGGVRQTISLVTDDVLAIPGTTDEMIRLPQRPVVSVASVELDGVALAEGSDWYLAGNTICRIPAITTVLTGGLIDEAFTFPLGTGFGWPAQTLTITYTHGYADADIPELVKTICLEACVRVWANPNNIARETIAGVQTVYDNNRFSPSGLLLTDDENKAIRRLFGRAATSITIGR